MFVALSRTLGFFVTPSNGLVALTMLGAALLLTRFQRTARTLIIVGTLLLAIAGWSSLGVALLQPLENRFPVWRDSGAPVAGIIVLGGAISASIGGWRGQLELTDSADRFTQGIALARRHPQARLIFTGAGGDLLWSRDAKLDGMARMLADLGFDPARAELDREARNTHEDALFARRIANPKPGETWLLVTSAAHMPRAVGCFRAAGFPVIAVPADYKTAGPVHDLLPFWSLLEGLSRVDLATREIFGLIVYRLAGYTDTLFPRP
jgi:uncharacterized SAM-binding protein YcdF (DUF218 family)